MFPLEKNKKPKPTKVMTLRLHLNIAENDLNRKLAQALKALSKGEQVRVQLQLKGREKSRTQFALDRFNEIIEPLTESGTLNKQPSADNLNVVVFPRKK